VEEQISLVESRSFPSDITCLPSTGGVSEWWHERMHGDVVAALGDGMGDT